MTAQVDWVSQPLRDAAALGEEFTAIQAKYSIDAKTLGGMASVAFKDGKVEISADANISAEAKADVEALLGKIKAAGVAITTIPKRASKASAAIGKMSIKVVGLAPKATTYLKKQLTDAAAELSVEAKASIELNLTTIPEMPNKIKATGKEAIAKVKAIPTEAKTTITELTAAFSGEGAFPKGLTNDAEAAARRGRGPCRGRCRGARRGVAPHATHASRMFEARAAGHRLAALRACSVRPASAPTPGARRRSSVSSSSSSAASWTSGRQRGCWAAARTWSPSRGQGAHGDRGGVALGRVALDGEGQGFAALPGHVVVAGDEGVLEDSLARELGW
jgi:hypothetical protein